MRFDWTITFGTLVHLVGMIIAGGLVYTKLSDRLARLETKVDMIYEWWTKENA